ncbi:hypothetical protein AXF15_06660 [Desulfomicrobium orale DSM 12838]|uniref:Uncharacterized protein n=1 Tax=Desulfomicrobium orale DSM 12838 TaxID=888061 RepID=A0A0X8JQ02_9BACT|nr:hypothetical protein AXF15_06660 [Desulfomicrobium orale DSM 12838]
MRRGRNDNALILRRLEKMGAFRRGRMCLGRFRPDPPERSRQNGDSRLNRTLIRPKPPQTILSPGFFIASQPPLAYVASPDFIRCLFASRLSDFPRAFRNICAIPP